MKSARFTITPPSNGASWADIDVSSSPLAGVSGDVPVIVNPVDKSGNVNLVGLTEAFVSAPDTISVAYKAGNTTPFEVLISIP